MKTIEIFGEDRDPTVQKTVQGCRGILIQDGLILLSYYKNVDLWLIPGGGLESDESLNECCIRELAEETGITVNAHTHFLTLEEYYHEYYFRSNYFICEYVSQCEKKLTENEIEQGLEPRWISLNEAMKIFGSYEDYKETDEVRYGAYYREYLALTEAKKIKIKI